MLSCIATVANPQAGPSCRANSKPSNIISGLLTASTVHPVQLSRNDISFRPSKRRNVVRLRVFFQEPNPSLEETGTIDLSWMLSSCACVSSSAPLMNHASAVVILALLLFGPLAFTTIEHNIEIYCLALGVLAT